MAKLHVSIALAALGDAPQVLSLTVREGFSEITEATVEVLCEADLDETSLLDRDVVVAIEVDGEVVRRFDLVVVEARSTRVARGDRGARFAFRLRLQNELFRLGLRKTCRIFQEMDVTSIVSSVLSDAGLDLGHVSFEIAEATSVRGYCVQYRETDEAFVRRLLEHEGIHFLVLDGDDGPKVRVSDAATQCEPIGGPSDILPLLAESGFGTGITELEVETIATPSKVTLSDYDHEHPSLELASSATVEVPETFGTEVFDYANGFTTQAEGQRLARLRAEAIRTRSEMAEGRTNDLRLRPGRSFELDGCAREVHARRWMVTWIEHTVRPRTAGGTEETSYEARFAAIPEGTPYRPALSTPRPRLHGVHAAVVTGPAGEEIHTDEQGRMKAKLLWDREGPSDDKSSCWMRVVQFPVGGSASLARVGWEMGIAYLDGDPDRPLGVTRFYTADRPSPYAQPGAKARSAFQTASSPGAGNSNEVRLDDTSGAQELFVHASYDFDATTLHVKTETVGVNETTRVTTSSKSTVGDAETISIGGNRSITIAGDETIQIGADRTKTVGGSETVTVAEAITTTIAGSDTETTGGSHLTIAALGIERTAVGSSSIAVGGSAIELGAAGVSFALAGARCESIGGVKLSLAGGSCGESTIGAMAVNVGGVVMQAAGGNRTGAATGASVVNVGGVAMVNGGSKLQISAKKISIRVGGVANLLGGGGIVTLTPGSASFVGSVGAKGSGGVKVKGNPNLIG